MEHQGIFQYSVVRTEGFKITLQKKPRISPLEMQKEAPKGREEAQSSPRKKELDQIQLDDYTASIRHPCRPDLPYQPTRKRPLELPSVPAQSSQVILDNSIKMPPVKVARKHPVGMAPIKSVKRGPKPTVAPLMKTAKKMRAVLWARSHKAQTKPFQQSKIWVAQPQPQGPSSIRSSCNNKLSQSQDSKKPEDLPSCPIRESQESPDLLVKKPQYPTSSTAYRHPQGLATLPSQRPHDAAKKSTQKRPLDKDTWVIPAVKSSAEVPLTAVQSGLLPKWPREKSQYTLLFEDLYLSSSDEEEEEESQEKQKITDKH